MTDLAYLPAGFETAADVARRRDRLARQLARSGEVGAGSLAALLQSCRQGWRCGSGACPECQRLWRRALLRAADAAFEGRAPLMRISWVPAGGIVPLGELPAFDLRRFLASRRRALQRALPDVVVFGGVDISHNTEANDEGYWQGHIYAVGEVADSPALRDKVRRHCPGEPTAPRPFAFREVRDLAEAFSYSIKAGVYRRSSYVDGAGHRNARPQALSAARAVEAALFQDRWPLEHRLLLRGLRLQAEVDPVRLRRLGDEPVVEDRGRLRADRSLERSKRAYEADVEPVEAWADGDQGAGGATLHRPMSARPGPR